MDEAHLRFNELCDKLQVSRYRVSKETGVSENTLSYWSRGLTTPTVDIIRKVGKYFGVSLTYFYSEDDDDIEIKNLAEHAQHLQILRDRPDIADLVLTASKATEDDVLIADRMINAFVSKYEKEQSIP